MIEEESVADLGNLKGLILKSHTANVSADTILNLLRFFLRKQEATWDLLQSQDFSLVAFLKSGREVEISCFENGETASRLAERRKQFLTHILCPQTRVAS
ncbi:hypothetical protein HYY75_11290 [bacterium]|nr:hypothetical protein [bacterium]